MTTEFAKDVVRTSIEEEIRSSYLDYSMSVIVGRALPSARDGLKPVHRRILYAMFREGLLHNRRYSKCAGVVGEVLKKYHPHGDSAVYDALVRMAQPWNLRYPLVDGQGNFGSIDGDSAAAYRYTESRMTRLAEELLADIDKETVDFTPNFDGQTVEPLVLPSRVPNLLINGAAGIAVGMATNIAPHNLGEIVTALLALLDDPTLDDDALYEIVPGPDFPTGGIIYGKQGCAEACKTGRGRIVMRGVAEIEQDDRGDDRAIVITEIPYQVNKARLVESIADLVRDKKIEGIRDVRDESSREGMRVVVELKRDAIGQIVLNLLFKHTALQSTFGAINLALVDGRPRVLSLKELLVEFLAHRREVVIRRCRFELAQAEARAHVLEGYLKALDVIDQIIAIIRSSADTDIARARLMAEFDFSHVQAQAILDMRLARLTALERDKLEEEHRETMALIERLRAILGDEKLLRDVIRGELREILDRYADPRRTKIITATADLSIEDLIADEEVVVTLSSLGYVKRTALREYEAQRRGGKGRKGMGTRDEDFVRDLFVASTHDRLMVFTRLGKVFLLPVYDVPEGGPAARGKPMPNLVPIEPGDEAAGVLAIREFDERWVAILTRRGRIKRSDLQSYKNIRANGIIACGLEDGDEVLKILMIEDRSSELFLATSGGKCIRFPIEPEDPQYQVRERGRVARGVRAMRLLPGDFIVSAGVVRRETMVLTITEGGFGKRTPWIKQNGEVNYRAQNRGGLGIASQKTGHTGKGKWIGNVVGAEIVDATDQVVIITSGGKLIRTRVSEISEIEGRGSQGVHVIRLDEDERVVAFVRVADSGEDDDGERDAALVGADEQEAEAVDAGAPEEEPEDDTVIDEPEADE